MAVTLGFLGVESKVPGVGVYVYSRSTSMTLIRIIMLAALLLGSAAQLTSTRAFADSHGGIDSEEVSDQTLIDSENAFQYGNTTGAGRQQCVSGKRCGDYDVYSHKCHLWETDASCN